MALEGSAMTFEGWLPGRRLCWEMIVGDYGGIVGLSFFSVPKDDKSPAKPRFKWRMTAFFRPTLLGLVQTCKVASEPERTLVPKQLGGLLKECAGCVCQLEPFPFDR